jgi:metal-responsive CopG/Arc/MetJ family transcriptional regulator
MSTNTVAFKLPSEMVNFIDRLAQRELEPRSAWARRVVIAELRRLETENKLPKDTRR